MGVWDVVNEIVRRGRGTQLAKLDIKSAYRNVPIHPDDRWLLGMNWRRALFVDSVLPFGLCSAPIIFTPLAGAAEWNARTRGVQGIIHYLDDFLIIESPGSMSAGWQWNRVTRDKANLSWVRAGHDDHGRPPETEGARATELSVEIVEGVLEERLGVPGGKAGSCGTGGAVGEDIPEMDIRAAGCEG